MNDLKLGSQFIIATKHDTELLLGDMFQFYCLQCADSSSRYHKN